MARILAFIVIVAACPAAWCQGVDAMSSILLVSKKDLRDPFFRDSVVLVTHRAGPAPVGVILNRATGIVVATALAEAAKRPRSEVVFFGGPVDVEHLLILFRAKDPPKDAVEVLDGVYMASRRETIGELLAREPPLPDIRVYAGYAAWGHGQLEREVARGDWHLVRADAATIFEKRPDALWRELEGRALAKPASGLGDNACPPPTRKTAVKQAEKAAAIWALEAQLRSRPSAYPEKFQPVVRGREKRQLGEHFGLRNFGVNVTRLAPGAASALRHAHTRQDEFIYIVEGNPVLVTNDGEEWLSPGMCAGFPCGTGNAHHLVNRTGDDVLYLEIGDRTPGDEVSYPDDDLRAEQLEKDRYRFTRKDGTPY